VLPPMLTIGRLSTICRRVTVPGVAVVIKTTDKKQPCEHTNCGHYPRCDHQHCPTGSKEPDNIHHGCPFCRIGLLQDKCKELEEDNARYMQLEIDLRCAVSNRDAVIRRQRRRKVRS